MSVYTEIIHVDLAFKCLSKYKRKQCTKLNYDFLFILILNLRITKSHKMVGRGILCFSITKYKVLTLLPKTKPTTPDQSNQYTQNKVSIFITTIMIPHQV